MRKGEGDGGDNGLNFPVHVPFTVLLSVPLPRVVPASPSLFFLPFSILAPCNDVPLPLLPYSRPLGPPKQVMYRETLQGSAHLFFFLV